MFYWTFWSISLPCWYFLSPTFLSNECPCPKISPSNNDGYQFGTIPLSYSPVLHEFQLQPTSHSFDLSSWRALCSTVLFPHFNITYACYIKARSFPVTSLAVIFLVSSSSFNNILGFWIIYLSFLLPSKLGWSLWSSMASHIAVRNCDLKIWLLWNYVVLTGT